MDAAQLGGERRQPVGAKLKILVNEVGYHRVNISAMLAGATIWAMFALRTLAETNRRRWLAVLATCLLILAQALAGRAGYVTSGVVCLVLCLVKWRRYLLVAPVAVAAVLTITPGVVERFSEGFTPATQSVPTRIRQMQGEPGGSGCLHHHRRT